MKRKKILIPEPKAKKNQKVMVRNFRRGKVWQEGSVGSLEYRNSWGRWSWFYEVVVRGLNGSAYTLYVCDDGIMSLKEFAEHGGTE